MAQKVTLGVFQCGDDVLHVDIVIYGNAGGFRSGVSAAHVCVALISASIMSKSRLPKAHGCTVFEEDDSGNDNAEQLAPLTADDGTIFFDSGYCVEDFPDATQHMPEYKYTVTGLCR